MVIASRRRGSAPQRKRSTPNWKEAIVTGKDGRVGYRPFGKDREVVGGYRVGDQYPDAPDELREAVDPKPSPSDYNRFDRAIYRWLARPRLWPRKSRRGV
jgi:hypothetical protein